MNLTECMKAVRKLVQSKGHEDTLEDFPIKCLFAIVEIGEAVDIWKKYEFSKKEELCEELIDALFYILDAYGLLYRDLQVRSPGYVFYKKWKKNMNRPYRYGRYK